MMAVDQIARMMALDAAQSGGGGGGGTDNYNDLTNRPKINGVTLTGNKTTSDLGIVENVQANWNETDSTAPSYIQNKPNIPSGVVVDTTYDGTSENAQAGTAVAQAVSTKVDKVTGKGLSENDFTNADKAKLDGIETGAEANVQANWTQADTTADDYIKNKPTIPTVNDATLTIQKNGTAVGTFSANAATAATINITVPVDADDVSALPDTTKYGASLALSIDSSTYVVTATLKDQDGNTLGTAQTIDLPLETVVVGGSYDDTTKKVVLTLKNGNTIDFSVADLVAGLQTEITSTNKLDADLVDDTTSVHKFVTVADKAAWNSKSDFSGSYNDLTDKPTIPAAVTVDQTYNATSTNPQSGTAVAQAIAKKPGEITTGKQYTIDGQTVTAGPGAEVFNTLTGNKASGPFSHAEGAGTTASGQYSHAEGGGTKASGAQSHAEGGGSTASGPNSHAEGSSTASGSNSHAEGASTTASGSNSHAEGSIGTIASGNSSHAEGANTAASGDNSHAEGFCTKASSVNQHVQGKFNVEDANSKYAFIIGNGTGNNARHNAFAIDWNGLIYVNGAATGVDVSQLTPVTVDQTYNAQSANAQSGVAVAQAVSGKISATDYATQNTGGTIKAWTTTDGSDTILHLATQ